ncbi:LETM1 domain-containing protein [Flavobacteriaceae bacterium XHP0103]|uniref:LETM1-related biofilm-associated protein n=1 Tax=Marixanthotalea marina TaxID=2844359 RepID=UPI002989F968|nr:LETM1-related biofilm-associated protein [Marixanthotalea marina]MBU3822640.1 LETM1 domain-containing protein [Marixanthotalea marina]
MNPSANGWIKKLIKEIAGNSFFLNLSEDEFYSALRNCGFVYGSNVSVVANVIDKNDFTEEELCKVNLLISFLYAYTKCNVDKPFIDSVVDFYKGINEHKTTFFGELLGAKNSNELLEKIINKRIQIDTNLLTKNFNYFIINAFLYVDILAYQEYLKNQSISINHIKNLEASIASISLDVLNSKKRKNQYDESLIKLLDASLRYQKDMLLSYKEAIKTIKNTTEKNYVLDLACMATWSDRKIDKKEQSFLTQLGNDLNINDERISQSIATVNYFYTIHKNDIALLSSKNIVHSFYDNSSKMVKKLITRNSKRLHKELKGSKELMVLLSQSTTRDLTEEEQKKVNEQLMDIFKSIPSLAIFMLPGGAFLLPLVIKFIPKLLPSAFDDNRIED